MTNMISTRDLGVAQDVFALPHAMQVVRPFSLACKTPARSSLSSYEIGLIRSLIEDNQTVLWLNDESKVQVWDMKTGTENESGIIVVL